MQKSDHLIYFGEKQKSIQNMFNSTNIDKKHNAKKSKKKKKNNHFIFLWSYLKCGNHS